MAWYDNPAFGVSHGYDDDDQKPVKASFGVAASKSQGDGKWCEACLEKGVYSWLDYWRKRYTGDEVFSQCSNCMEGLD